MYGYRLGAGLLLAAMLSGCDDGGIKSPRGFSLPDGDAEKGRLVYAELKCNACHTLSGEEFAGDENEPQVLSVALGGEVTRIKTYGELVTSIINPSHRLAKGDASDVIAIDGESRMTSYNDVMTVRQLIDLVAFLQSRYKLERYDPSEYPVYFYEAVPSGTAQD